MITNITKKPKLYSAAYNPILWAFTSDVFTLNTNTGLTVSAITSDGNSVFINVINNETTLLPIGQTILFSPVIGTTPYSIISSDYIVATNITTISFNYTGTIPVILVGNSIYIPNAVYDHQFIIDVYINGTFNFRKLQRPNLQNYCFINLSEAMQQEIDLNTFIAEGGYNKIFLDGENKINDVYIKVGEQYGISEIVPVRRYNGNGNGITDVGEPAFSIYAQDLRTEDGIVATNKPITVLPVSLNQQQEILHLTNDNTNTYGFFEEYIKNLRRPLSHNRLNPQAIPISRNDQYSISVINWDYSANTLDIEQTIWYFEIIQLNVNGDIINTSQFYNQVSDGGGPQTSSEYTVTPINTLDGRVLTFQCGPANIIEGDTGINILPNCDVYYVNAFTKSNNPQMGCNIPPCLVSCLTPIKFKIINECETDTKIRLSWLNSLGGRDYYTFNVLLENTITSNRSTYNKSNIKYNGINPYPNTTDRFRTGGNKTYNNIVSNSYRIVSDIFDDLELNLMRELFTSSDVIAYINNSETPVSCQLNDKSITTTTNRLDKLPNVTFNLSIDYKQTKQTL